MDMPIDRVEDTARVEPYLLGHVIEKMIKLNSQVDEAVSITIRNNLLATNFIDEATKAIIQKKINAKDFVYRENPLYLKNEFEPIEELVGAETPGKFVNWRDYGLEFNKNVWFIDTDTSDEFKLAQEALLNSPMVIIFFISSDVITGFQDRN